MEYKIHKIIAEEKLSEISEKYNVNINDIKKANPNAKFFKAFLGAEYAAHMQELKIPMFDTLIKETYENDKLIKSLIFKKAGRYRCKQINTTKALEDITFSSDIKTQYLLSSADNGQKHYHSLLEDYIFQINPKELSHSFELVKPIELLKNDVIFTQNLKGDFEKILNQQQIEQKWETFRKTKITSIDFFNQLKNQNEKAANDFIRTLNREFSNGNVLKNTLNKNLFYHILLKSNIGAELQDYSFTQSSQIFPNQDLLILVKKNIVSEKDNILTIKLTGELQRDNISETELEKLYNEIYKPILKFSYTEFDFIYRITYSVNTENGLLLDGRASFSEKVKNNFECITQFEINQIEL